MYISNAARRLYKTFFDTTNEDWHYRRNVTGWKSAGVPTVMSVQYTQAQGFDSRLSSVIALRKAR